MSQDKLILIYTVMYTTIFSGTISLQLIKEKKIKFEFAVIWVLIIFLFSIGLVIYFYMMLFCGILQLFIKNYIFIQVLLNLPMIILAYKILKK